MDKILVATESVAGNKIIKGPVTGIEYEITPSGTWIADEFPRTDKILDIELFRFCFRTRTLVQTKIFILEPSWMQMESMPN